MNESQEGGVISINDENDRMRFECPLSLEIMEDPVIAEDGITYEREEIERWISTPRKASPQLIASFTQAQEELAQIASNNDGTPEMQTRHQEAINAVEQIRREIETAETLTSPTTNLKMGEKLIPNTILKDIIENSIFDKEHASTQIQTEEKEVDSTEVQTEEKQVDSIDVQTPESIIDETLTENALEIADKVSDNIIDEYIGDEMLKTRKSKVRDKKKRQKKGKKERDRIEKDKALAEEAIANAMNAMASQTITEEKDLFYSIDWEQIVNRFGLTKDGNLDEINSDDIFADFYIIKAQSYAFQYLNRRNGATIKDLMKEGIPYLIHKEAYQIESLRFIPDGRVDKDSIKKEIKDWLENIIEIQDRLLKAGFFEDGKRFERFIEEKNTNDSLRKDVDAFKVYRDTERHILNTRREILSVEMDKKYWGAATKTNNKGEEVGLSLFTTSNTTIKQKFQGLFLFWLNCIKLTAKMSLQEIQEFVNSMFYKMTAIQMQELNGNLPIEQWNFEMVKRGLRVGYISGAAVIAAWVRILHDFETIKLKNEQILKLSKWWSEIASHVGDGTQKGGVIYVDNENDQDDFKCPITLEVMEEPTLAADGFSYERKNIEAWIKRKKDRREPITSPVLGEVMGDNLVPNVTLKNIIQNTRFDREPTSDSNTQTEEKKVDSIQVQTEDIEQVDAEEDIETEFNKMTQEQLDKKLEGLNLNRPPSPIKTRKLRKKLQEKNRKLRRHQAQNLETGNMSREDINVGHTTLPDLYSWNKLIFMSELKENGELPYPLTYDIIYDFYIEDAQAAVNKLRSDKGFEYGQKKKIKLIGEKATQLKEMETDNDGIIHKDTVVNGLGSLSETQFIDTSTEIRKAHRNNISEEIQFYKEGTSLREIFEGMFDLFVYNPGYYITPKYYRHILQRVFTLTSGLNIPKWNIDMVKRGLRIGSISSAALILAYIVRLSKFKDDSDGFEKEMAQISSETDKVLKLLKQDSSELSQLKLQNSQLKLQKNRIGLQKLVSEQHSIIEEQAKRLSIQNKIQELERRRGVNVSPIKGFIEMKSRFNDDLEWFQRYEEKVTKLLEKLDNSSLNPEENAWVEKQLELAGSDEYKRIVVESQKGNMDINLPIKYIRSANIKSEQRWDEESTPLFEGEEESKGLG